MTTAPVLEGQTAIVTGGSSGIGAGIARALAEAGAAVTVNYRSGKDAADRIVDEIAAAGGTAIAVEANVTKETDVETLFDKTLTTFGAVDILVANSGIQKDAPVETMSLDAWNAVMDVNLTGQFLCCRRAVVEFRRRGIVPERSRAAGKIICMSSVHEVIPWAGRTNYAASKGGVMLLMKSLAQEVAHDRIRVNSIAPGAIRTPINQDAWDDDTALDQLLTLIPYGRIGEPEDIANAAVWLASDLSDYVTGTTLFVDGGMTLYPGFRDNG
ncbi:MAG: glucose 1-dehydrogenase [Inquilinaceae bacterium]